MWLLIKVSVVNVHINYMSVLQISSCDAILATMEDMLGKFQSDLGNISSEIRALQEQSQSMSVRLRNRKAAEARLGTFLDNLALPPSLIDGVLLAPPDAGFAVWPFPA